MLLFFEGDNRSQTEEMRQLGNVLKSHPYIPAQDAPEPVVADSFLLACKGPGGSVVTDCDGITQLT